MAVEIRIADLEFSYPNGAHVLRGVSLEIRAGARVAILGKNGAGKTTLIKHLNGLLKPSRGAVHIGDRDTRDHTIAQMARQVGFVFQNPDEQLFKTRVWDEVAFGPTNLSRAGKDAPVEAHVAERVEQALALCGLDKQRDAHPYDLPPWQRRWVAIASVVAMGTPVVVLDEPTTGQDALGLARLKILLDDWRRAGVTVITVTHDVDFAAEQFPDLIVMGEGKMVARGGAELFADAAILARAASDAPQLMRLARALGREGAPVTVEAFCDALDGARG